MTPGPADRGSIGQSVTGFARRCADQDERDYAKFAAAVRSGKLTAAEGARSAWPPPVPAATLFV